jgi:hypothetical protein
MPGADKNFKVKIITEADRTGSQQTLSDLDAIAEKERNAKAKALLDRIPPKGATPPTPPEDGAGSLIGSLIGSFSGIAILGLVENVASRISAWAENLKRAAEEQRGLNREINQAVKSYEKIRTPEQWDRENNKIEENIQKLRDKRAITTDRAEINAINQQIAGYERQQTALAILAQRGLERAQAEEKVKLAIRDQINLLAQGDRSSQHALAAAENRAKVENQLTDLRAKGISSAVDVARERGLISETQAVALKAKIERDADEENFRRSQDVSDKKISSINNEIARTKAQREEAEKGFKDAQQQQAHDLNAQSNAARLRQEQLDLDEKARSARKSATDIEERGPEYASMAPRAKEIADQAEREAEAHRILAQTAEREANAGEKRKESLDAELKTTKAILEDRQRAEQAAKTRGEQIPDIEAQKKADAEVHAQRLKNQDNNLSTLQEQHDKLVDITKSRGITEAERKAAYDAAQGLEPQIRDEQFKAHEQARNAELDRMTKRTQEGPAPGLTPQQTLNYFTKGPGAAPGTPTSDTTLKEILGVLRQQVDLWR